MARLFCVCIVVALACAARAAEPDAALLAREVGEVLKANCHACHGRNGSVEGGVNYILDLEAVGKRLVSDREPKRSKIYKRLTSASDPMPPEVDDKGKPITQRPTKQQIDLVRRWIEAGAPAERDDASDGRAFVSDLDILRQVSEDLGGLDRRDRRYARYFTITHLHNAGLSEDELQTYRAGLSKLVNSLSWGRRIAVPTPVDAGKTIFRIDLRDYQWTEQTWARLVAAYPYGASIEADIARTVQAMTACDLPLVRGDWFVHAASRPPLYHEVLGLPHTDLELERQLRIDVAENIRSERVVRAGFNGSGVSRNNRLIERHESPYGAYWKSYDFDAPEKGARKNLFAYPLGPDPRDHRRFAHDGGEIIFNLPNGLQAYFLVDAQGRRIDAGPTAIVSDPRQADRAVVNGVSCMSCHARGIIPKEDQVRQTVVNNAAAFAAHEVELVKALYPQKKALDDLMAEDAERFARAVEKTGAALTATEPVAALALRFEADLDLTLAAAEAGLPAPTFRQYVSRVPALARTLGPLNTQGGAVRRAVFVESFPTIVAEVRRDFGLRTPSPQDAKAFEALRVRAEEGDVAAMVRLATLLQDGRSARQDAAEALRYLRRAADAGHRPAMTRIGWTFQAGLGVGVDGREAAVWYRKAIEGAEPDAMALNNLGFLYRNSIGVQRNDAEALALFARAAEMGHAPAMSNLGWMHEQGRGTKIDPAAASKWYVKAAELGDEFAKQRLSEMP